MPDKPPPDDLLTNPSVAAPTLKTKQMALVGRVVTALSADRLDRFAASAAAPKWEALANYAWNVALCEAFYPLFHHIEVVLRNALDTHIAAAFPPKAPRDIRSWLDCPTIPLTAYAQGDVTRAKKKLGFKWNDARKCFTPPARAVHHADLLAALDFGFWTGLVHKDYLYQSKRDPRFWLKLLQPVFPHAPGPWDRAFLGTISADLNYVRKFRNRVFHHEPIWRRPKLLGDRDLILKLIGWSSPEVKLVLSVMDRVQEVASDDFRRALRVRIYRETRQ